MWEAAVKFLRPQGRAKTTLDIARFLKIRLTLAALSVTHVGRISDDGSQANRAQLGAFKGGIDVAPSTMRAHQSHVGPRTELSPLEQG